MFCNNPVITDKCEAFDVAIGLYEWLSHNYGGMGCDKYAAMSKMVGEYRLSSRGIDSEGSQMVYDELDEDNWEGLFMEFCRFMDDEWDDED